eukprot:4389442-Amphidinium_carterae.1
MCVCVRARVAASSSHDSVHSASSCRHSYLSRFMADRVKERRPQRGVEAGAVEAVGAAPPAAVLLLVPLMAKHVLIHPTGQRTPQDVQRICCTFLSVNIKLLQALQKTLYGLVHYTTDMQSLHPPTLHELDLLLKPCVGIEKISSRWTSDRILCNSWVRNTQRML